MVAEAAAFDAALPFGLPVLDQLSTLISVDVRVGYIEFNFETHAESYAVEQPLIEYAPEIDSLFHRYCQHIPLRPKLVGGAETPLMVSDFLSQRALHRNPFYLEVMRPSGIEHELHVYLPAPSGTSRAFEFVRGPGRDFDERDRAVLTLLRPHLARLRRLWEKSVRSDCLTAREREIVRLVATGLTNREIAEQLVISTGTVRTHLARVYEKLGVHTRTAAVAAATP